MRTLLLSICLSVITGCCCHKQKTNLCNNIGGPCGLWSSAGHHESVVDPNGGYEVPAVESTVTLPQ